VSSNMETSKGMAAPKRLSTIFFNVYISNKLQKMLLLVKLTKELSRPIMLHKYMI